MGMEFDAFFDQEFDAHSIAVAATRDGVRMPFRRLVDACARAARAGGKIVFFGNGGSAADAQHLATELTVRYAADRAPIAALALTTDSSALTAIGNDFGFASLFARQITALCRGGRCLHRHFHLGDQRKRACGADRGACARAASPRA